MGWEQSGGHWWYKRTDGTYPWSCWEQVDGRWYYFNARGLMLTGWQFVNGWWYYLTPSGDAQGAATTGWAEIKGERYYFEESSTGGQPECSMHYGWTQIDGDWYYFEQAEGQAHPFGALVKSAGDSLGDSKGAQVVTWADMGRRFRVECYMVAPRNLEHVYGKLEGVDLSESSLTGEYYTDTRTSGTLKVVNGNYIKNTLIRVVASIPERNWRRELGTFAVTGRSENRENGAIETTLDLSSMLATLSNDVAGGVWSMPRGTSAKAAVKSIVEGAGRSFVDVDSFDAQMTQTVVLDPTKSQLAKLYSIANVTGGRLDVDGHGNITLSRYVPPSERTPAFDLSLSSPNGIVVDGVKCKSDFESVPNRVVVSYSYQRDGGSTEYVTATVDASGTGTDKRARGWVVADVRQLNNLSPRTREHAMEIAKQRLSRERESIEWELKTMYIPVWEGDVVSLEVNGGEHSGTRKCLVKSVKLDLKDMTLDLTLKETGAGDAQ